jgi:hypothetical protein
MDQTLSLGWMQAQARSRRVTYQRALALSLILYVVLSLFAIISPATLSELIGLPDPIPSGWLRAWAGILLLVAALYIPGLLDPVRWRWGNVVGIVGRFVMAVLYLFLGGPFLLLALFEAAFALLLSVLYLNLFKAELMSRP